MGLEDTRGTPKTIDIPFEIAFFVKVDVKLAPSKLVKKFNFGISVLTLHLSYLWYLFSYITLCSR